MKVVQKRYIYFMISAVFLITSVFLLLFSKLNLWIDMTGGIQMEYTYKNLDISKISEEISNKSKEINHEWSSVINNTSVYKITWENTLVVIWWFDTTIDSKTLEVYKNTFRQNVLDILTGNDSSITENSYINIWKSFWDYIKDTAKLTLIIAIVSIAFYVAWAFSWVVSWINVLSFSGITIITLFHDVLIASWLYVLVSSFMPEFKIDTFFVTALLTILWYSINDTIVVFDRVRANLKFMHSKKQKLDEVIDFSISETLRRSMYTSLTLLFVLVTIFFFWPETIKWFTLVMIFWTIIWTYSSIFLASPLLYEINKNKKLSEVKKEVNIEDKIVV